MQAEIVVNEILSDNISKLIIDIQSGKIKTSSYFDIINKNFREFLLTHFPAETLEFSTEDLFLFICKYIYEMNLSNPDKTEICLNTISTLIEPDSFTNNAYI